MHNPQWTDQISTHKIYQAVWWQLKRFLKTTWQDNGTVHLSITVVPLVPIIMRYLTFILGVISHSSNLITDPGSWIYKYTVYIYIFDFVSQNGVFMAQEIFDSGCRWIIISDAMHSAFSTRGRTPTSWKRESYYSLWVNAANEVYNVLFCIC